MVLANEKQLTSLPFQERRIIKVNIPQAHLYSISCMSTLTRTEPGLDQDNKYDPTDK